MAILYADALNVYRFYSEAIHGSLQNGIDIRDQRNRLARQVKRDILNLIRNFVRYPQDKADLIVEKFLRIHAVENESEHRAILPRVEIA